MYSNNYYAPLWDWKAKMCQKCIEGPDDMSIISKYLTCRLPSGIIIHKGRTCDGCRYQNPRNLY